VDTKAVPVSTDRFLIGYRKRFKILNRPLSAIYLIISARYIFCEKLGFLPVQDFELLRHKKIENTFAIPMN